MRSPGGSVRATITAMRRSFAADQLAVQELLAQLVALDGERT